jgi:tetratricopeptide (TPR) repeat protein
MNEAPKTVNISADRSDEMKEKLATGQITLAEFAGIDKKQLYEIARQGYQLFNSGKLDEAEVIYSGLVAADPFDSVFHCHLGAVYFRKGEMEKAFDEYSASIRLNLANVDALSARGEIYLQRGELKEGIEDLRKALENDPEAKRPSTQRARALLLSLRDAAQQQQQSAN